MSRLREVCAGARLDDDLFEFLMQPEPRQRLRMTLIDTYFAPEVRLALLDQATVNFAAYEYSKGLLSHGEAAEAGLRWAEQEEPDTFVRIRDQGFRKAIVSIYDHRCALCGIRMLTPDGHTVFEAAHIKPWSESRDDKPTNGLSLCRLWHQCYNPHLAPPVSPAKQALFDTGHEVGRLATRLYMNEMFCRALRMSLFLGEETHWTFLLCNIHCQTWEPPPNFQPMFFSRVSPRRPPGQFVRSLSDGILRCAALKCSIRPSRLGIW
jgi:hypothetical protein